MKIIDAKVKKLFRIQLADQGFLEKGIWMGAKHNTCSISGTLLYINHKYRPCQDGLVVSVSASHGVGPGFVSSGPGRVIPKTIIKWYKLPPCMARIALG